MADTKISALPAVTDVLATDEYVLARAGVTNKITAIDLTGGIIPDATGWISYAATWTYASASTFTVSGDQTAVFSKGTRLRFTQTTVKYAVVVSSSFGGGTTTVTIGVNDDYTVANAAITSPSYSYSSNPQGYPVWFNFSPTVTGYGSAPADTVRYRIDGSTCQFMFDNFSGGTSNATTFTVTMPVQPTAAFSQQVYPGQHADNGTTSTTPTAVRISSGTNVIDLFRDWAGLGWTASGTKWARFIVQFEF